MLEAMDAMSQNSIARSEDADDFSARMLVAVQARQGLLASSTLVSKTSPKEFELVL